MTKRLAAKPPGIQAEELANTTKSPVLWVDGKGDLRVAAGGGSLTVGQLREMGMTAVRMADRVEISVGPQHS